MWICVNIFIFVFFSESSIQTFLISDYEISLRQLIFTFFDFLFFFFFFLLLFIKVVYLFAESFGSKNFCASMCVWYANHALTTHYKMSKEFSYEFPPSRKNKKCFFFVFIFFCTQFFLMCSEAFESVSMVQLKRCLQNLFAAFAVSLKNKLQYVFGFFFGFFIAVRWLAGCLPGWLTDCDLKAFTFFVFLFSFYSLHTKLFDIYQNKNMDEYTPHT